jgi:hypothetical protein
MSERRRVALITGASAGLGAEFAEQLAARQLDLILTARRADRLKALKLTLESKYAIRVEYIPADLSHPTACRHLLAAIDALGLPVDWLINNAGYGLTGTFNSRTWNEHAAFLRVLLEVPTQLTHALLPRMRAQGFGRVINVASLAGLVPSTAGHTLYGAVKSYLVKFSQSLAQEERVHGIHVCALCPGFTYTEFHDVNGTRERTKSMPAFMWMSAAPVVAQGIEGVERGQIIIVNGLWNKFVRALTKLLPEPLALALVRSRAEQFRDRE